MKTSHDIYRMLEWRNSYRVDKMVRRKSSFIKNVGLVLALVFFMSSFIISMIGPVSAASIAQGYTSTDSNLVVGMAASLSPASSSEDRVVERASTSNRAKFVGIVTTSNANLLTLTSNGLPVVVATTGEATAIISDLNGAIHKGDYVAVSPLRGVLMKAGGTEVNAIGTALEDLGGAEDQQISTNNGSRTVKVGTARIEISPSSIALATNDQSKSILHNLGMGLAGRTVSDWQVLTAMIIFLVILIIEGSLVYGAIHSTIIALGRNPLAHDEVYKQLFQVLLAVLGILAFGMATIYAVIQF